MDPGTFPADRRTRRGELQGIAPTGRRINGVVCDVIEARDGRIYREREYSDGVPLLHRLGAVPAT